MSNNVYIFDPNDNHDQMINFAKLIQNYEAQDDYCKIIISEISYIKLKKNRHIDELAKENMEWIENNNSSNLLIIPRPGRNGAPFLSACLEQIGKGYDVHLLTSITSIHEIMRWKIPYQGSRLVSLSLIKPSKNHEVIPSKDGRDFYRVVEKPKTITRTDYRTKYRLDGESYVYPIKTQVLVNQAPVGWVTI